MRIEPHRRPRIDSSASAGSTGIHLRQPGRAIALGEIGIELDHAATFRERAVMIAPPQQNVAERHVADRLLIVQFERAARPSLGFVERLRRIGAPSR